MYYPDRLDSAITAFDCIVEIRAGVNNYIHFYVDVVMNKSSKLNACFADLSWTKGSLALYNHASDK